MKKPVHKARSGGNTGVQWWKWAGMVIGVVVLAALAAEAGADFSARRFDGKLRYTRIAAVNGRVELQSFDPGEGRFLKVILPDDLEVATVAKGKWLVKSLPELGRKYGEAWYLESISAFLGVPVTAISGAESFWDKLMWWWYTKGEKAEEFTMSETGWIAARKALDGLEVYDLGPSWQAKAGELFYSSVIATSGWKLAVFNSTGVAGLGAKLARLAETQGFKVVTLAQSREKTETCVVRSRAETRESVGVRWLAEYFGCNWQEKADLGGDEAELTVGDKFSGWGS